MSVGKQQALETTQETNIYILVVRNRVVTGVVVVVPWVVVHCGCGFLVVVVALVVCVCRGCGCCGCGFLVVVVALVVAGFVFSLWLTQGTWQPQGNRKRLWLTCFVVDSGCGCCGCGCGCLVVVVDQWLWLPFSFEGISKRTICGYV
jgi:hypothetical protein